MKLQLYIDYNCQNLTSVQPHLAMSTPPNKPAKPLPNPKPLPAAPKKAGPVQGASDGANHVDNTVDSVSMTPAARFRALSAQKPQPPSPLPATPTPPPRAPPTPPSNSELIPPQTILPEATSPETIIPSPEASPAPHVFIPDLDFLDEPTPPPTLSVSAPGPRTPTRGSVNPFPPGSASAVLAILDAEDSDEVPPPSSPVPCPPSP